MSQSHLETSISPAAQDSAAKSGSGGDEKSYRHQQEEGRTELGQSFLIWNSLSNDGAALPSSTPDNKPVNWLPKGLPFVRRQLKVSPKIFATIRKSLEHAKAAVSSLESAQSQEFRWDLWQAKRQLAKCYYELAYCYNSGIERLEYLRKACEIKPVFDYLYPTLNESISLGLAKDKQIDELFDQMIVDQSSTPKKEQLRKVLILLIKLITEELIDDNKAWNYFTKLMQIPILKDDFFYNKFGFELAEKTHRYLAAQPFLQQAVSNYPLPTIVVKNGERYPSESVHQESILRYQERFYRFISSWELVLIYKLQSTLGQDASGANLPTDLVNLIIGYALLPCPQLDPQLTQLRLGLKDELVSCQSALFSDLYTPGNNLVFHSYLLNFAFNARGAEMHRALVFSREHINNVALIRIVNKYIEEYEKIIPQSVEPHLIELADLETPVKTEADPDKQDKQPVEKKGDIYQGLDEDEAAAALIDAESMPHDNQALIAATRTGITFMSQPHSNRGSAVALSDYLTPLPEDLPAVSRS